MQEGVGIHLWDIPKTQLPHLGEVRHTLAVALPPI